MLHRSAEDFHNYDGETQEAKQKRARMADRSVPTSVVEREIIFMISSAGRINNTNSGNPATIAQECGRFIHRRPNLSLLVVEEACQFELLSLNMFNYSPPIPSSFFIRFKCSPIGFAERHGVPTIPPTEVLTRETDSYYPIGSISGFYNFPPLKVSFVPDTLSFDILECTTNSYFPGNTSDKLEIVVTFKLERLGENP